MELGGGDDLRQLLHVRRLDVHEVEALVRDLQVPQVDPQVVRRQEPEKAALSTSDEPNIAIDERFIGLLELSSMASHGKPAGSLFSLPKSRSLSQALLRFGVAVGGDGVDVIGVGVGVDAAGGGLDDELHRDEGRHPQLPHRPRPQR